MEIKEDLVQKEVVGDEMFALVRVQSSTVKWSIRYYRNNELEDAAKFKIRQKAEEKFNELAY